MLIAGQTSSPDFPATAGAFQPHLAGAQNAFVCKIDPAGQIVFCTYLGGSGSDAAYSIRPDGAGNIYAAGSALSLDFPTTPGSFQPTPIMPLSSTRGPGGFVARLSSDGKALAYSTYVVTADGPGAMTGGVFNLSVTAAGDAYFDVAWAEGVQLTGSAPLPCTTANPGTVLEHFSPQGALLDATFLDVRVYAINPVPDGSVLVAGRGNDVTQVLERVRFGGAGWTAAPCLSSNVFNAATMYASTRIAPGELITLTGFGIGPDSGVSYQPGANGEAPLSLGGVRVLFDGQPAPIV